MHVFQKIVMHDRLTGTLLLMSFFFKQKPAYEMRISDWSSYVCSSDLAVNNIAYLSSFMWKFIAGSPASRCLIPLTEFAEAEGTPGSKMRTWFRVKGEPIFAWAGMWKTSDEWGPVYSGLLTDCNDAIRPVHDRMPVLLMPQD